jgi:hypothetical protein
MLQKDMSSARESGTGYDCIRANMAPLHRVDRRLYPNASAACYAMVVFHGCSPPSTCMFEICSSDLHLTAKLREKRWLAQQPRHESM